MPSINHEILDTDWVKQGDFYKITHTINYDTPDKVLVQCYELTDPLTNQYNYTEPSELQIKENETDSSTTDIIISVIQKPDKLRLNILYGE
jgi:hypothetical protein